MFKIARTFKHLGLAVPRLQSPTNLLASLPCLAALSREWSAGAFGHTVRQASQDNDGREVILGASRSPWLVHTSAHLFLVTADIS